MLATGFNLLLGSDFLAGLLLALFPPPRLIELDLDKGFLFSPRLIELDLDKGLLFPVKLISKESECGIFFFGCISWLLSATGVTGVTEWVTAAGVIGVTGVGPGVTGVTDFEFVFRGGVRICM